ncbi:2-hydroxyacyl-CoA dehydratase subunit D [Sporomusa acidovorans]|uniref:Benzoyl-CoA reductase subunit C n=1 Tax=Sporomusa acidovorans (strain ATCC 49682 / DSM 3132 / Mol) TaxID=1123286 RepID=A0ABZ3IZU3_SPOA4|nr:2-hydroxyacyl-CoA dehydratase family protein [Sporomusa acidovorans]OZC21385.1 benzoyl-CoA reductase subunit C [Sporomusa acidovorans DSM 3132]SDE55673.1 benzoyl-CoA reductase (2-electron) gamma subunit [Sporomusa acidovorans]
MKKAMEIFKEAASTIYNSEVAAWKEQGGKVAGYFYPAVPEEILTAAGVLAFGIRGTGSTGTELADAYFRQLNCGYTRSTFEQILQGEYKFLDGAVVFNQCDHMRRIYDNWLTIPENPCYAFIYLPKKNDALAREFYEKEIIQFKQKTEEKFGVTITDNMLKEAIMLHNETRRLQRKIYELKKRPVPPLSGADTRAVMLAATAMPRKRYNELLTELLHELTEKAPEQSQKKQKRLLYIGIHDDDIKFMEALESQGATIVADYNSIGYKAAEGEISTSSDPLQAIIDFYFYTRAVTQRQFGTLDKRLESMTEIVKAFQIDGVITARLTECDQMAFVQFILPNFFKEQNIPILNLEVEYILDSVGQLKTRVQAFLETMEEA